MADVGEVVYNSSPMCVSTDTVRVCWGGGRFCVSGHTHTAFHHTRHTLDTKGQISFQCFFPFFFVVVCQSGQGRLAPEGSSAKAHTDTESTLSAAPAALAWADAWQLRVLPSSFFFSDKTRPNIYRSTFPGGAQWHVLLVGCSSVFQKIGIFTPKSSKMTSKPNIACQKSFLESYRASRYEIRWKKPSPIAMKVTLFYAHGHNLFLVKMLQFSQ